MAVTQAGQPSRDTGLPPGVEVGPLGRRFVAYLIESVVPGIVVGLLAALLPSASGGGRAVLSIVGALLGVGWALLVWYMLAERAAGPGMRVMKLQLVGFYDGRPIGWIRVLLRALVFWALSITGIGLVVMLVLLVLHPRKQGWHDQVAKAVVIKERVLAPPGSRPAVAQHVAMPPQEMASSGGYAPQPGYGPPPPGYGPPPGPGGGSGYGSSAYAPEGGPPNRGYPPVPGQGYGPMPGQGAPGPGQGPGPGPGPVPTPVSGPGTAPPPGLAPVTGPLPQPTPPPVQPLTPPPGLGYPTRAEQSYAPGPPVVAPDPAPRPGPVPSMTPNPVPTIPPGSAGPPTDTGAYGDTRPIPPAAPAPAPDEWHAVLDDGRRLVIDHLVLLGRNPQPAPGEEDAELVKIADETRTVSKLHLAVGVDPAGLFVVDRGSTNGSTVTTPNGVTRRCAPGEPVYVDPGSIVSMGDHWLEIRRGD